MCLLRHIGRLTRSNYVQNSMKLFRQWDVCQRTLNSWEYPINESVLLHIDGSEERRKLEQKLQEFEKNGPIEVPVVIGDEEIKTSLVKERYAPFDHSRLLAKYHYASVKEIHKGIRNCLSARSSWERTPIEERASIFARAADLICNKYRHDLLAATMLGQGKTIFQAEVDAIADLADFLRFNTMFAKQLETYQPINTEEASNYVRLRGMEGFWAALTPFNSTSIAGNLAFTPALMGNVVMWKPSPSAILSNWIVYKIFREAGLPPGVINFFPASASTFGNVVTDSEHLAGINFTGNVATFRYLFKLVGQKIFEYKSFPRLIGETGGKNYHFVHPSADVNVVANCTIRSAFEYSGQKCGACSRLYVPLSMWHSLKLLLSQIHSEIKVGSPLEKETYVSAVIDSKAYDRIKHYIDFGIENTVLVAGGQMNDKKGFYIQPTIFKTSDPQNKLMTHEIYGPVLTVYTYKDDDIEKTLHLVNNTSPYGLAGSIFARDQAFIDYATDLLKESVGNFFINTQSTGAVVGQQPFGGSRLSGTNDKAGGPNYPLRFTSPQAVKIQNKDILTWWQAHMK